MARRKLTQLAYDALTLEGGLFNAEWLAKVAHLEAPHQKPDDYGIPAGLNLRDEIARAWRIAQALWIKFQASRSAASGGAAATEKFVVALLEAFAFAGLTKQASARAIGERSFPISHALHRIPVLVAAHTEGLDEGQQRFGEAGRRRSPFSLLQEYLNAADQSLWGLVCNGTRLRLVRDNASLTRPAWLEADLERIFTEERFADFSALWLTIHVSRFGAADSSPTDCALEAWREAGQQAGTRARDELRKGVERALLELGQGFLSEASNAELRAALVAGTLTPTAYFQQLLRLVYRLIFLLTVEERGLLHPPGSDAKAQALYERGYSLRRLRERAIRHSAHDTHRDLYASLTVAFRGLAGGEPRLALPALGGLFATEQTPVLDAAQLQNRHLVASLWALAWIARDGATERVNWRDMGPEELGSVYESLLELRPQIGEGAQTFRFASESESRGSARKLSGSYYTPDSLVQVLLDYALEPVIARRLSERPQDEASALLSITVVDPAVGSGHFLLAAARRLAAHLARIRAQGQPGAAEHRKALRDVVSHCLFGVDRNPMALELAKIALWLEAMTPESPLSFLDSHLALGDGLLGLLNFSVLKDGVPQGAYKPLLGDDPDICSVLKKRNKAGQRVFAASRQQRELEFRAPTLAEAFGQLDAAGDETLGDVAAKKKRFSEIRQQALGSPLALAADLYVAAHLMPKTAATQSLVPTSSDLVHLMQGHGESELGREMILAAQEACRKASVLHWPLTFPQVFAKGGFDVVFGNPPWETMSPDAKEYFSSYVPGIAGMTPEEQEAAIGHQLEVPAVAREWYEHCRALYAAVLFMKEGGRYTRYAEGNLGKGDFNVYRQFVELAMDACRPGGYAAQVVPENFYNGANAAGIRKSLFDSFEVQALLGFENHRKVWFNAIDSRTKFALYVARKGGASRQFGAAFSIRNPGELAAALSQLLLVDVSLLKEFSPEAQTVMEFSNQFEIDICRKMYASFPHFGTRLNGLPYRDYMREVDMGNDNDLFEADAAGLPLFQGSMVTHHDYRAKGYVSGHGRNVVWEEMPFGHLGKAIRPQWYIAAEHIPDKCESRIREYRIGFCDVGNATNQRALMAALIPPNTICGHKVPTISFPNSEPSYCVLWLAVANSLAMDFLVRMKIALTMSLSLMDTLPFPRVASRQNETARIAALGARLSCAGPEMAAFLELLKADHHLADFDLTPVADLDQRRRISAEIDARVARDLYGLTRNELAYILDPKDVLGGDTTVETFRSLRDQEVRQFGEYRTRRLVLEAWDSLEAERPVAIPVRVAPRRTAPYSRYAPTGIPCCEAEDWLAGVICDAAVINGPMSESALRLLLTANAAPPQGLAALQTEWLSKARLDRLPLVLKWLRSELGLSATADISINDQSNLAQILGDNRTEQLARLLTEARRAEQDALEALEREPATADSQNAGAAPKRA
ncbi:Eco57I restriction-modification methylase domain-containing protein [Solimonas soli]|uniref:Eco57I restriction-modification methylase domain-containing protein n=1 Tax=Solimonas soli TaxID=413479 RepID=UPI0004B6EC63|nr:N-6 DNA methylase [Solimonas soli]